MQLFFVLLTIILLGLSLLSGRGQNIVLMLIFSLLFVLSGYREFNVGTDTSHYQVYFNTVLSGYELKVEPGWVILNKLVIYFGGDYRSLLVIVSLITLGIIWFVVRNYSSNPILSVFLYCTLYFYFYSFNISRQLLSVSIILLAYVKLLEGKRKFFLGLVLLAFSFHFSAFLAIIPFFASKIKLSKKLVYTGLTTSLFFGLFLTDYIFKIITLSRYGHYTEDTTVGNLVGNALFALILNSFFLFLYFNLKDRNNLFLKIFFVSVIISDVFCRFVYGNRIILFLSIIQILLYPMFLGQVKQKYKPLFAFIIILYSYILFFRVYGGGEIFPYYNSLF